MHLRAVASLTLFFAVVACAQKLPAAPSPLDPARHITPLTHTLLPEEYLWTAGDVTALRPDRSKFSWSRQDLRTDPHYFRAHFHVDTLPAHATLYIAGPRDAEVFLNGRALAHFSSDPDAPIGFRVFHVEAAPLLHRGDNVLAIAAIRGRGIVAGASSNATIQLTYGEVLAAKIIPAAFGRDDVAPLLISDKHWHSAASASGINTHTWTQPAFDDSAWQPAESLGPVESSRDLMQWSSDAGMYGWPGYMGMSAPLGAYALTAETVTHVYSGSAHLDNIASLTTPSAAQPFTVINDAGNATPTDLEAPAILLDFGREVAGRLFVRSASSSDATLSITYGESELEALATGLTPSQRGGDYLGTNLLDVPANGVARGPKSAFRYVRIRFLRGSPRMAFSELRVEGIAYPVDYAGSFESSDPLLNRIWETGAYTVHLCMQDDLWDAPKRDRGRWAGDMDVEARTIEAAFGEQTELERTLAALVPDNPTRAVNGIPNYSALWVTTLATLYNHSGDIGYLRSQHAGLVQVLSSMEHLLSANGLFTEPHGGWAFVDWAPGLYGLNDDTRLGTNLHFILGFETGAQLLDTLNDHANSEHMRSVAASMRRALASQTAAALPFGATWQINALAVRAGLASDLATGSVIWSRVLSHVKQDTPQDQIISPYFNATVIDAMAALNHQREALDWIRAYWGGMIAEGATSFWESYDLRWPKTNFHLSLAADGTNGYFVSLAHGWSSGPTPWLTENVLGVRDPRDGFRTVTIAPRLLGLSYARGSIPTPHGPIRVSMRMEGNTEHLDLDIPNGIDATLDLPSSNLQFDNNAITKLPTHLTGHHTITFTTERLPTQNRTKPGRLPSGSKPHTP